MAQKLIWKVTVTGKKNSGKSSIISRAAYNTDSQITTRGFVRKKINTNFMSDEYEIDLLFLEMPYETLNQKFLSKSTFVLFIVDITDMDSLKDADLFMSEYNNNMEIFLLALKSDMRYVSQFWEPEISRLANKYGIAYFIYSNKDDFSGILEEIIEDVLAKIYNQSK
ncbi:GTPase domain-containing protein [Ferroplasma sp.]|uniref:GTPase domain-containing protein n=1 Tax=Ferroplasma sp. TaxID=2591003 RepID=UPI00307D90FC